MWQSSSLLGGDRNVTGSTDHTAEGFAAFFVGKVDDVMVDTAGQPLPQSSTQHVRRCRRFARAHMRKYAAL